MNMNNNVKLIQIPGVTTPVFNEPKGEAYARVMQEISKKVDEKRLIYNTTEGTRKNLNIELNVIGNKMLMSDDEFEIIQCTTRKKEIQNELSGLENYAEFNINAYAKKLINDPEVQKMKREADKELLEIIKVAELYYKAVRKHLEDILKTTGSYISDTGKGSESATRRTNTIYNNYHNAI